MRVTGCGGLWVAGTGHPCERGDKRRVPLGGERWRRVCGWQERRRWATKVAWGYREVGRGGMGGVRRGGEQGVPWGDKRRDGTGLGGVGRRECVGGGDGEDG
ncbi:hypothetical protein K439DRAFT_1612912 [Ramaria rubella]|nr:hypothetical protein K439DRAFT_1612912 [Ramaria rubella]